MTYVCGTNICIWQALWSVWHEALRLESSIQNPVDPNEVNIYRTDKLLSYIAIYFIPIITPDKIYVRSTIYK